MPFETFLAILKSHERIPGQGLGPFIWRHGPEGVATIYDHHLPRRVGIPLAEQKGRGGADWWFHSQVLNCPYGTMIVDRTDGVAPGYRQVLTTLLSKGCVIPSACMDQWLGDDSRRYCDPQLRLFYRKDL